MCGHEADADDVLQDALLAIATHLDEYQARSSFTSWAFAIARSACSHRRRGLKNRPSLPLDLADETVDASPRPDDRAEQAQLAQIVGRALEALPEDQREVLLLRDVEGLTTPEAASALGLSVEALKSRLHRARRALHEALGPGLNPTDSSPAARADCPDVLEAWSRNLEGDLRRDDCVQLENHLRTCGHCTAVCTALKREIGACSRSRTATVSPEVRARVEAAVAAWRTQPAPRS
jgi:RNA polymerase sigma-70 factor (ECF subfamily)